MYSNLPEGSDIRLEHTDGHEHIEIPHKSGGGMRVFMGLFLLFWLGGWTVGFFSALSEILSGKGSAFLVFWLGGWTLGGLFAGYMLYRIFKTTIAETIVLNKPLLMIDTGVPPFRLDFKSVHPKEVLKSLFPKRQRHELKSSELKTLKLRENEAGNRLTVDVGNERIDMAVSATEVEREWLYRLLQRNYGL